MTLELVQASLCNAMVLVQASLYSAMLVSAKQFSSLPGARWRTSLRPPMKTSARSRFLCMIFLAVSSPCDHIYVCNRSFCTSVHLYDDVGYLLLLLWCLCVHRVYGVYVLIKCLCCLSPCVGYVSVTLVPAFVSLL